MITFKCKMCGGDLHPEENATTCECEYCGSVQTVPTADNEKKMNLIARAQRLFRACEFDKAAGIYESVVAEFPGEAEAYWGLVLCKYGIEYVDDPITGKKVPTCHRSSFDSLMDDANFEQACENTDAVARRLYRDEAKTIEELRKRIIEVSGKEEPYDIFICYKEKDENGNRTLDSVLAQDIYNELTEKGYRVFFSRITLEDKLGQEYEPYIFAALNSAKIMLVVGTDYEYHNAVWVKNEWSRYLNLIAKGEKKTLIPCYKGIDAYDMPKEFARLQAQDMGKIGAMQDLVRGINKILPIVKADTPSSESRIRIGGSNINALLQRGKMALEDAEWEAAINYFDQVLNMDAKNSDAYLGVAMAEAKVHTTEEISRIVEQKRIDNMINNAAYLRFLQFSTDEQKQKIDNLIKQREILYTEEIGKLSEFRHKTAMANKRFDSSLFCIVGLKTNGTVLAVGTADTCDRCVKSWEDIISISAGNKFIVGLKPNGKTIATGYGESDNTVQQMCAAISHWENIKCITSEHNYVFGVRNDGTVVFVNADGIECVNEVNSWTNIDSVALGVQHVIGVKKGGKAVALGNNQYGQCDVSEWADIVAVTAGMCHSVGLKSDGTVVAVGSNQYGECNVNGWKDIIAIAAGIQHTVGLRSDGTVVSCGFAENGACDVSRWKNIVAINASVEQTVGLRSDGTLIITGQLGIAEKRILDTVRKWKLFNNIDTLDIEQKEATEKWHKDSAERAKDEQKKRRSELFQEQALLEKERSQLKGLFSNIKKKRIDDRLEALKKELEKV